MKQSPCLFHCSWPPQHPVQCLRVVGLKQMLDKWRAEATPFSSVARLYPTLWDPMDCSTPGFPVHHQTPRSCTNSCPSSQWCYPAISSSVIPFSSCLQSFPASGYFPALGYFPVSQFFTSSGQSIGVSASASVLPMNIQDWFPLEATTVYLKYQPIWCLQICTKELIMKMRMIYLKGNEKIALRYHFFKTKI